MRGELHRRGADHRGDGCRRGVLLPRTLAIGAAILTLGLLPAPARADPVPDPLLWRRRYVAEVEQSELERNLTMLTLCQRSDQQELTDNNVAGRPKIAVVGESVENQTRDPTFWDGMHRWRFVTRCGDNFDANISSGRLDQALAIAPDILVAGFGSNNFSVLFRPYLPKYPVFEAALAEFIRRTEHVRCRVIFNIPERIPPDQPPEAGPLWLELDRRANALLASYDGHNGITVIDWNAMTVADPGLVYDDQHLTRRGINTRINTVLAATRHCYAPDAPNGVRATPGNGMASVTWTPVPAEEGVTSYRVTSSSGRSVTTSQATVNMPGLTNGVPVQFSVVSINAHGQSTPSYWSAGVTPSAAGARFHSMAPRRALDTRSGLGKSFGFGPGESFALSLSSALPADAANASAVVLNVTATGQTEDTFVTAWPGGSARPLASNLNPRPGIDAVPAMVTTGLGTGNTVQLFNNTGSVHLIVDVVGWFDRAQPGTGSLYTPVTPTRVLDSRAGIGNKIGPFQGRDTHHLTLDALPADATAAVVNVTATNTTNSGFVTIFPTGTARPTASSLNPQPSLTRANLTAVEVGPNRSIDIYNNTGTTDLIIDLVGSFGPLGASGGGSEYFPITPERHVDTRDGTGGITGPVSNAGDTTVAFTGRGSLPAAASTVSAVDANITVVDPAQDGHTTAWPSGTRPATSILNFLARETVPNRDLLALDSGSGQIWSTPTATHYVVDVSGWFGPVIPAPVGGRVTVESTRPSIPTTIAPTTAPPTAPRQTLR